MGVYFILYPIVFTDRCETFNSFIRAQNIYGNKSAPSHDISVSFATTEQLRYICEDGYISGESRRVFSIEKLMLYVHFFLKNHNFVKLDLLCMLLQIIS